MEIPTIPLDASALRASLLAPAGAYRRVELRPETGSTNADLLSGAADWPDPGILLAESQLAGRGRLDRQWSSPAGSSLIVSMLLRPASAAGPLPPTALGWLPLLAALALTGTLRETAQVPAVLKWPNDVLVRGAKISGILAQLAPPTTVPRSGSGAAGRRAAGPGAAGPSGSGSGAAGSGAAQAVVVLGTGLNVTQERDQLPVPTATSLALEAAAELDRNILLVDYASRFAGLYLDFCAAEGSADAPLLGSASLLARSTALLATLGAQVRAELPGGAALEGLAAGLDRSGALLITDAAGRTHIVHAGDVVHLRPARGTGNRESFRGS